MKFNKEKIALIVVAVLLVAAIGYIGYTKYQDRKDLRERAVFEQGALYGYQSAITQLIQTADGCKPVSVYMNQTGENLNMSLIDVACLQQQASAGAVSA